MRNVTRADPSDSPALGESRGRVLDVLHRAGRPLGVDEIAERMVLHPNTIRFHLDALVARGLVERASEQRDVPGRPRRLYTAAPGSPRTGRRSYRLLTEILTSYLAANAEQPRQAALAAGEAWGRLLADRPTPLAGVDEAAAMRQLVDALDDIGFAPEAATAGQERQILLHHCPFREAAEQHRDVVCGVHLGLMRGMLEELDAPVRAERLDPFVEPNLCITHLGAFSAAPPDRPIRPEARRNEGTP